jgi:hypothetical protein
MCRAQRSIEALDHTIEALEALVRATINHPDH